MYFLYLNSRKIWKVLNHKNIEIITGNSYFCFCSAYKEEEINMRCLFLISDLPFCSTHLAILTKKLPLYAGKPCS